MGFELLGLGFAISKTLENGNGIYISSDTLGFLIIGTGILRKIRLENGLEISPPFRALPLHSFETHVGPCSHIFSTLF